MDCEQEHDLRNHDLESGFSKALVFLVVFGVKLRAFHKSYLQIPREGVSNGEGFGRKVRNLAPKNIKKPCTRHGKVEMY